MADHRECIVPDTSTCLHTGRGHVVGLVISSGSPTAAVCQLRDSDTEEGGTKIFECMVCSSNPVVVWFKDQYAPRFADALYVYLGPNVYATIWYHIPME